MRYFQTAGLAGASCLAMSAVLAPSMAAAQVAPPAVPQPESGTSAGDPATSPAAADADIVVTGSRVARAGYAQPTPVTIVSSDQLTNAKPGLIAESLAQLPAFKSSTGATNNGNLGVVNLVNLRALGPNRTLVLLDGRRMTPSTTGSAPDINTIPQALVSRVDIVTGGASAAYGSDAVAGVVNFTLDTHFTGLKGQVQKGISGQGDNAMFQASLSGGLSFAGDRGHIIANVEYYDSAGITEPYARAWNNRQFGVIPNPAVTAANPASASNPNLLLVDNVRLSNTAVGGLITSGPLAGTQFGPGGAPQAFNYGTQRSSSFMVGGDGPSNGFYTPLASPIERYNGFIHAELEASDNLTFFAEGSYFNSVSNGLQIAPSYAFTIYSDNAYLPAATRAAMQQQGLSSFPLARDNLDWGLSRTIDRVEGYNSIAGFKGSFDLGSRAFKFDGYVQHGRTSYSRHVPNDPINVNVYNAADSVVVTAANVGTSGLALGSIACRTTLSSPANGCVPINLFGPGAAAQQALNYVYGEASFDQVTNQTVGAINLRGSPFATWAGDVQMAVGGEYRNVSTNVATDKLSQTLPADYLAANAAGLRGLPASLLSANRGVYLFGNYQPIKGSFNVKEAYAEVDVPLAKNAMFARELSINGAVRYADYSTAGAATTWKVGGVWQIIDDFRLRATRSRDVRAPNIAEIFSSARLLPVTIADPVTGTSYSTSTYNVGNLNLKPEKADTLTFGAVLTPTFMSGFALSADYYHIKVNGAISTPSAGDVLAGCQAGNAAFCSFVTRDSTSGLVTSILLPNFNLASIVEKGVDIEASYRIPLSNGGLTFRVLANYVDTLSYQLTPTAIAVNRAGEVAPISTSGATNVGVPKWTGTFSATYERGPFTLYVQERYVDGGHINNTYNTSKYNAPGIAVTYINNNDVESRFYTDLTMKVKVGTAGTREFFLSVNNLFDRDPPATPFAGGLPLTTNAAYYDVIGRQFTAGFRFQF